MGLDGASNDGPARDEVTLDENYEKEFTINGVNYIARIEGEEIKIYDATWYPFLTEVE